MAADTHARDTEGARERAGVLHADLEEDHRGVRRQVMSLPLGTPLPLVLLDIPAVPVVADGLDGARGGELVHEGLRRMIEPDVTRPELGAAERPGCERCCDDG